MSTETKSLREQTVGMSKDQMWDLFIIKVDELSEQVKNLESKIEQMWGRKK